MVCTAPTHICVHHESCRRKSLAVGVTAEAASMPRRHRESHQALRAQRVCAPHCSSALCYLGTHSPRSPPPPIGHAQARPRDARTSCKELLAVRKSPLILSSCIDQQHTASTLHNLAGGRLRAGERRQPAAGGALGGVGSQPAAWTWCQMKGETLRPAPRTRMAVRRQVSTLMLLQQRTKATVVAFTDKPNSRKA